LSTRPDFPETFLFGAATAAHQVEGDNRHNDWWRAERQGRLPHSSGAACRHFELYEQDFDLARGFAHNAHRLSIEWSRIEPREGRVDPAALDHYRRVLEALRGRGIEPVLTLHHFTHPCWFADAGAWTRPDNLRAFARYVETVAEALGDLVGWWVTVNEPTVLAKHAHVTGDWPPFGRGDWKAARRTVLGMSRAHRTAYDILHRRLGDVRVGFAHSAPWVMARRPATLLDRFAALSRDLALNRLPVRLAAGPLDFLGVNYYTRALVHWRPRGTARLFGEDWPGPDGEEPRRFSEMGWEVWPQGLELQLRRFSALGVPLLVSENGLATGDEEARSRFLLDHLRAVARALRAGVQVCGYLWWSLLDNFEWAEGFRPRFGLFATDYVSFARTARPAAELFAEIARSRRLPDALNSPYFAPPAVSRRQRPDARR